MNVVAGLAGKRDRSAKQDAIVLIAKEIFLREGFSATSMATIAAQVGGSKATLYNYFPSKEELFEAVVREFCGRIAEAFGELNWDGDDFRSALVRFGRAAATVMISDDVIAMHRLIVAEAARFKEIGEAYYQAGMRRGKEKLYARFQAAIDAGHIRSTDSMMAAQHFFDLCVGGLHRRRLMNIGDTPTRAELEAHVEAAVDAFLNGYAAR